MQLSHTFIYRVWEKIAEGMQLVANSLTGLKARISSWAKTVGLKGNHNKMAGYGCIILSVKSITV